MKRNNQRKMKKDKYKDEHILKESFIIGIFAGLVSGIPLFAYDYLLNRGLNVTYSAIAFLLTFIVLFWLANRNINKRFKNSSERRKK